MPTKQYCDYIAEQEARRVRIEQQFKYEPVQQPKRLFWMCGIDRKENAGETEKIGIILVIVVLTILGGLLYFAG